MVDQPRFHDRILKRRQVSILALLGFTTIVALVSIQNSFWGTIFAIEMIAVYLFITSLIEHLPNGILSSMNANCIRRDGALDPKRLVGEQNELIRLFWALLFVVGVVFLVPINWSLWYFQSQKISPDGVDWTIAFVGMLCAFSVLHFAYLKLLRELQERIIARSQGYWGEDASPVGKGPLDD